MYDEIGILQKKMEFQNSASFNIFKDSLKAFLMNREYRECFPALKEKGVSVLDAAEAFKVMIMFHPSDAAKLFGQESNYSYTACINSFKDFPLDYKRFLEV